MKKNLIILGLIFLLLINSVNAYYCYQESANTTNQGGLDGNCGLVYNGNYSQLAPPFTYINYTIPSGAIGALWRSKHGNLSEYNSTIPASCFNSGMLILRFNSYRSGSGLINDTSYGQCYNTSNSWYNVTFLNQKPTSGGTIDDTLKVRAYDGDWNTQTAYLSNSASWGMANAGDAANLYEEGIYWNILAPIKFTFYNNFRFRIYSNRLSFWR